MKTPGIHIVLNLSPRHMTASTRELVEGVMDGAAHALYHLNVYAIESGEYLLKFDYKEIHHKDTPEDLRRIMEYAKANGAYMIYFDEKADILEDLPVALGEGEE